MSSLDLSLQSKKFILHLKAERGVSAHTVRAYEKDLRDFARFAEKSPGADLGDLRKCRLLVREFWAALSQKNLRLSSILRKLAAIRSFFNFLVREGAVQSNPFVFLKLPRKDRRLPVFLSEAEMARYLSTLEGNSRPLAARDRALSELLYSSGLRIREALGLNVEDMDLWNGIARVFGKGGRERVVPIGKQAVKAVELYLDERKRKGGSAHGQRGALFLNARGGRLGTRGAALILAQWAVRSSLSKHVSPHMFRHSFATHVLNGGCDLRSLQEMMGHRSLSSTQIYTHTSQEQLRKIYGQAHPRA